jgi:hypothetical protein
MAAMSTVSFVKGEELLHAYVSGSLVGLLGRKYCKLIVL